MGGVPVARERDVRRSDNFDEVRRLQARVVQSFSCQLDVGKARVELNVKGSATGSGRSCTQSTFVLAMPVGVVIAHSPSMFAWNQSSALSFRQTQHPDRPLHACSACSLTVSRKSHRLKIILSATRSNCLTIQISAPSSFLTSWCDDVVQGKTHASSTAYVEVR